MPTRRRSRKSTAVGTRSPLRRGVVPSDRTAFTNRDLAVIGGCLPKTLSEWRRVGLLPRATFAGASTRYGRESARLAAAIGRMGVQAAQHPRFEEMLPLILDEIPRQEVRTAAAAEASARASSAAARTGGTAFAATPAAAAKAVERSAESDVPFAAAAWQRIELVPGIEIHLADFVPPIMRGVVREVAKRFGRVI